MTMDLYIEATRSSAVLDGRRYRTGRDLHIWQ
jgi:hypothetical protein